MEKNFFEWVMFFFQSNWQQFLLGTATTLLVSLSGTINKSIYKIKTILLHTLETAQTALSLSGHREVLKAMQVELFSTHSL